MRDTNGTVRGRRGSEYRQSLRSQCSTYDTPIIDQLAIVAASVHLRAQLKKLHSRCYDSSGNQSSQRTREVFNKRVVYFGRACVGVLIWRSFHHQHEQPKAFASFKWRQSTKITKADRV